MARDFADKSAARQWVWDRLSAEGVARFPFPPHGRIPNFAGAEVAAARLLDIEPWKSATAIKVNPDSPQRPVRAEALRRGITVFVPTPRLRGGFKKLDPRRIPPDKIEDAASLSRGDRWSEEVALADIPRLEAIVCGSVAVTRDGRRCGKGEGYSDLEFAILRELGHPPVPVATTVHDLQVVASVPRDPTDQPLSVIATPTHAIRIKRPSAAPTGIDWTRLTAEDCKNRSKPAPDFAPIRHLISAFSAPLIGSGLAAERQVMAATVAPFRGRGEMPRPKVAMRRIKEVLRLKEALGLSDTAVSRSVRIARSTVKEYLDRAAAAGLNWETVAELSEEELDRRLFAAVDTRHSDRPLPDWEAVEKELRGRGVTLRLLWLEYLSRHPEGYRYTQFCAHFHAWPRHSRPPTMRPQA